jgi:hypothetical protein
MQPPQKQHNTVKLPQWLWQFIVCQTGEQPANEQLFLAIFKPMSPQEWCRIWIPRIHPHVEAPHLGGRCPTGYMKASIVTLCELTGYSSGTVEGWFYGKSYHHNVGILLRCLHILFQIQGFIKFNDSVF